MIGAIPTSEIVDTVKQLGWHDAVLYVLTNKYQDSEIVEESIKRSLDMGYIREAEEPDFYEVVEFL